MNAWKPCFSTSEERKFIRIEESDHIEHSLATRTVRLFRGGILLITFPESNHEVKSGGVILFASDTDIYYCPEDVFNDRYTNSEDGLKMNFGKAIEALKNGKRVAREGWNGKGMFLYFVPPGVYPARTAIAKNHIGDQVPYGAYIAMKTAQGNVVPWLASQTDMLATDWEVVE